MLIGIQQLAHTGVHQVGNKRPVDLAVLCCAVLCQVGVTCNFNDVHNSRVEVRPDRAYLKQQLKAVEARVLAIQEKKRKLDQRMSVLTSGLKVCADREGVWVSVVVWGAGSSSNSHGQ